jgi:chemotaxis protein MotB
VDIAVEDDQDGKGSRDELSIPKWMPTFADMMTLLMCFFVLLLTFAEMDIKRYQQIAGSMSEAFGVQAKLRAQEVPMGTSVIAREFSPGVPTPTPISEIYQQTDRLPDLSLQTAPPVEPVEITDQMKQTIQALINETRDDASELAGKLETEISKGEVEIETHGRRIVLRIREKGSFSSGSAELRPSYRKLMLQLRDLLATQPGAIQVRGHTDDVPIATARFRSNWELSTARAVSVAEELLDGGVLDPGRFTVSGYAETRPVVPNDSVENRARNRRVEIVIQQGIDETVREQLEVLKAEDPEYYKSLGIDEPFNMLPAEVF